MAQPPHQHASVAGRRQEEARGGLQLCLQGAQEGAPGHRGISKKAMAVFDDMMTDAFKRIASEAKNLCQQTGKKTLSSREIQTAVRLILPGAFPRAYCAHRALREAASSCSGRFD